MSQINLNSIVDLKTEGKSFYWASFFLPSHSKMKAATLYSICRFFDNLADNDITDKTSELNKELNKIIIDENNQINKFLYENNIDIKVFQDLITGFLKDQSSIRIKDESDLIKYSYHVAGTVGLMMSKIIGVEDPSSFPSAIDLGIAMQITNIARDVYEDAKKNRIYIPKTWIGDIDIEHLVNPKNIAKEKELILCKAIHQLIDLSHKFYSNGFYGLKYIPIKTRLSIFVAAKIYQGIGFKIKKKGNVFLRERIYLTVYDKILITLKSLTIFIFLPYLYRTKEKIREKLPNENL